MIPKILSIQGICHEVERQLKLKPETTTIGPPYIVLNGEEILKLLSPIAEIEKVTLERAGIKRK